MNRVIFFFVATAAAMAATQAPETPQTPPPASVAGTWTVQSDFSGNQSEQSCAFTQKEAALTGTCTGERGSVMITGKVDAKTVAWQFETQYEGQTLTVSYNGTSQSAEKITGTVNVQPMNVDGQFTATKTK